MFLIIIVSIVVISLAGILYYYLDNRKSLDAGKREDLDTEKTMKNSSKRNKIHWIRKGPKGPWG